MAALCDNCGKREAASSCEFCGSQVCEKCNREMGCKACKGGVQTV